ncbi:MAG: sec-independent protein translocase protein TatA [Candidatus Omnitrophota bacterium]|jgi:sec-independent protein translocase protein TatA
MFGLGPGELIVIFLIVFLLFGPKALPEIAKGLGQAIRAFKKETKEVADELSSVGEAAKITPTEESKPNTSDDFKASSDRPNWRPDTQSPNKDA